MRYPGLVPKSVCTTPVKLHITDGITESGAPNETGVIDCMCNWQETAKTVLTADKRLVTLSGSALFSGDVAPEYPVINGKLVVGGVSHTIHSTNKARNPDGTVNYTRLDVM